jgi:flavin-dependent dehydrogenase
MPDSSVAPSELAAQPDDSCDVLVIGGGPGGSTIANLLARQGRRVILVEKEKHPRFHIGESLLPLNLQLIDQLGLREEVARIGMLKPGAEFVSPDHERAEIFSFSWADDKRYPYAYQVRRSEFDHLLLKHAAASGARVIEECRVESVDFLATGGASVTGRDSSGKEHRWTARFVADASGRDTVLSSKFGFKRRSRKNNTAAIYGHFRNARRLAGEDEGNITIAWFAQGWFWFIPLADGTTSVGAVAPAEAFKERGSDLETFYAKTIASCPEIADRLKNATKIAPVTATGNYSYSSTRMWGKDFILVGDAFAFLDPVFSTGVYLAMKSAFLGAEAVATCLDRPQQANAALRRFDRETRRGLGSFGWFIYRVRAPAFRSLFMVSDRPRRLESAVMSVLAGDVFGGSNIGPRLLVFKAVYMLYSRIKRASAFMHRLTHRSVSARSTARS